MIKLGGRGDISRYFFPRVFDSRSSRSSREVFEKRTMLWKIFLFVDLLNSNGEYIYIHRKEIIALEEISFLTKLLNNSKIGNSRIRAKQSTDSLSNSITKRNSIRFVGQHGKNPSRSSTLLSSLLLFLSSR